MNRLWIWVSLAIGFVVVIVAFMPLIVRTVVIPPAPPIGVWNPPPAPEGDLEAYKTQIENRMFNQISRTLALGALLGVVVGIILARWLVAPLHRLEEGAKAVARHEYDVRLPVEGSQEMRSVSESLNRMTGDLQRQEELRRNMLADVTHELRHPVHVLQGSLRAILDGVYPLNMQEVDRMLEQTQHLTAMVDDLHALALAEARELKMDFLPTDLALLVEQTTEAFQALTSDQGVALQVQLPSEALLALIDANRVRQALQNLIGNALHYTPSGGGITVSLERADGLQARLCVQDSGAGIAPADLPHVFDRFYRSDTSRNRQLPGAGLGLAIAQALIQANGGSVEADSAGVGKGSRFTILLPLQEQESGDGILPDQPRLSPG